MKDKSEKDVPITPLNFSQEINRLGYASYEEYLQSEHWQNFRARYFKSKRPKYCLVCKGGNFQVELHHCTYQRLGRERLYDVIPLCREHHELVHERLGDRPVELSLQIVGLVTKRGRSRGKTLRGGRYRNRKRARGIRRGSGEQGED